MISILNKPVSYYPNHSATAKGTTVNLLTILHSRKHKAIIEKLRNEPDPTRQQEIKDELPCYCVTGVYGRRNNEGLITSSGLACVDLDNAENYVVLDLLNELRKISYIAYAGLSCRGKRLFLIVPFATSEYDKHYERLIQSFIAMGLPIGDNCHRTPSQPRYVSDNDEYTHWFNHGAKLYGKLPATKTIHLPKASSNLVKVSGSPFNWCVEQINKSHSFKVKERHPYILQLVRYCNLKGLSESDTLYGCLGFVQADFTEREITSIVKNIYLKQKDSHDKLSFNKPGI